MKLLPGLAVLIAVGILYVIAFRKAQRSKYAAAIGLILICGLFLRVYLSLDFCLHDWDERYHALVAKNMIHHPLKPTLYDNPVLPYDYRNWSENHIWLHKQPLPLWFMAASMFLFGVNEIALRLPSILLSTLAIWLTYLIGRRLFSKKIALLAAFLHSTGGMIIELTSGRIATDHIDVFFLFFVELAVYFAVLSIEQKGWLLDILTGVAMGLAILCKWLPALIVVALWMIMHVKPLHASLLARLMTVLFATALIVLPWQVYIHARYPAEAVWESLFNYRHITETLEGHAGPFYYHFNILRLVYGEIIYIPLLWLLVKLAKKIRSRKRLFLATWIAVPLIFFSFVKTKMQAYTVFAAPALFLLIAYFFYYVKRTAKKWRPKWLPAVCLFLLVAQPLRYSADRLRFFRAYERKPEWATAIKQLKNKLPANSVIFNHPRPIEVMFYTNSIAYRRLPSREELDLVKQKGYTVAIVDLNGLPPSLKNDKDVLLLKEK